MTDWFIRDEFGSTAGPYEEAQIRDGLETKKISDTMSVRQQKSDWIPAARVREMFAKLAANGFFIRDHAGQVFGPFTRQRVLEMDRAKQLPNHYWIKQGNQTQWTEIRTKLKTPPVAAAAPTSKYQPKTDENIPIAKPVIPAAPVMKLRGNTLADRLVTITERVEDALFGSPLPNG